MVAFPPCKINIGLYVINKRDDGYHNLVSCFYPVPWTDVLEVIPSEKLSFSCSGSIIPGNENDNLCLKAYALLRKEFDLPAVKIHLHKIIPTGAGLGGGSSDAAYTLRMLNTIFKLNLSSEKLSYYASILGSDCSFFIYDKPRLATSRGEILSDMSLSLSGHHLIIVKPEVHVSTAEAYGGVTPQPANINLEEFLQNQSIRKWKGVVKNDFEDSVFKNHPVINDIKNRLYEKGALYASMSGSGSAVFGIFESNPGIENDFKTNLYWSGDL